MPLLARIKPVRHWQLPGPRAKPLKHDADAIQQAVRQITDMQRWVRYAIRSDMSPHDWDALLSRAPSVSSPNSPMRLRRTLRTLCWLAACGALDEPQPPQVNLRTLQ